jgi:hypothetical protein
MKWFLKLYPPAWRQRYQEEMLALLELHHVTWRTVIDLLWGALDARFDPHFKTRRLFRMDRARRLRYAHSTVFWAFPLLVLGQLLFIDELDDVFYTWNQAHPVLSIFKSVSGVVLAVGFFAFVLTGLLLACILAKQATTKRVCEIPQQVLCYTLAPICLIVAGMAAHLVFIAVWGVAIWNVPAQTVQQMAQAADRHVLPGGWWHLPLMGGIFWLTWVTGWALCRLGRTLIGLMREKRPGAEAA